VLLPLDAASEEALRAALDEAGTQVAAQLDAAGANVTYALDLRYAGQSYELTIDLHSSDDAFARGREAFHTLHEARYGHADRDAPVEVVNVRATARVASTMHQPPPVFATDPPPPPTTIEAWFDGRPHTTALHERATLRPGDPIDGPSIVAQFDSTTVVPPGWRGTVDEAGNLLLERA
jgi:N-methylhydantoinase A